MKQVRGSEISDFMRCRYRWAERWINNLQPKKPDSKLLVGTLVHKWLEAYYQDGLQEAFKAMGNLFAETDITKMDQTELDDLWSMCNGMVNHYYEYRKEEDAKHKTVATELNFVIPLDDQVALEGTIDYLYEDEDGYLWFCDHKTTKSIESYEKNAILDRQISRYWWALQQLTQGIGYVKQGEKIIPVNQSLLYQKIAGRTVQGFIYNLLLKEIPKPPKVLKNGSLSKDKSQNTTFDLYIQALIDIGLYTTEGDNCFAWPEEYVDILEHLRDNGKRYFARVNVTRLQPELNAAIAEFYATACDLQDVETAIRGGRLELAYRNITDRCHWDCPFKAICAAGIEGSNVQMIRESLYTTIGEQTEEVDD